MVVEASYDGLQRGRRFRWSLSFDDVANTVDLDVELVDTNDAPIAPLPGETGGIDVILTNNQPRSFDFMALGFVNAGPQQIQNVRVKVTQQGRNTWLTLDPFYTPPTPG